MERDRRQQDRPVKRLRQLQSRLEAILRDAKELREAAQDNNMKGGHDDK